MKLAIVFSGQVRDFAAESIYSTKRLFPDADYYYGVYDHEADKLPINDTSNAVFFPEPEVPEGGHIWWHGGRKPNCKEYDRVLYEKIMTDKDRWERRRHQSKQFYNHFYTTKHFNLHEKYDYIMRIRYDVVFNFNKFSEEEIVKYFEKCFEFDGLWGLNSDDDIHINSEIEQPIDGIVKLNGVHKEACNDHVWTYPSHCFTDEDNILDLYHLNLLPPVEWGLYRLVTEYGGVNSSGKIMSAMTPHFMIGRSEEWIEVYKVRRERFLQTGRSDELSSIHMRYF